MRGSFLFAFATATALFTAEICSAQCRGGGRQRGPATIETQTPGFSRGRTRPNPPGGVAMAGDMANIYAMMQRQAFVRQAYQQQMALQRTAEQERHAKRLAGAEKRREESLARRRRRRVQFAAQLAKQERTATLVASAK